MKNFAMMVLSLFLALVVWSIVSAPRRGSVRQRIVTAPLSIVALPSDLMITTEIPASVTVRVRGRSSDLRALSSSILEVPVDLHWVQGAGEVEITLRPEVIDVPPEVVVESLVPNKIRFRIEQLRQRSVPIRPFLVGTTPEGYLVGEASAAPAHALVSGPSSHVMKLDEVATERIIMTGRTGTFVQNVAVVSDSPLVRVVEPLTTAVTVPVLAEVGPDPLPDRADASTTPEENRDQ